MNRVISVFVRRGLVWVSGAAASLVALLAATGAAQAAVPSPVAFELRLSPYARVLDAIGEAFFDDVMHEESCDNPHLRVRSRNKPALMLTNDLTSVAPITSFTLTINEGPFFFGKGDFATDAFTDYIRSTIYSDPGVSITGSSISPDGKTLTVNFDGLTAGKKAIFNVDVDSSDAGMFPYPDYRNVLFGAPTSNGGSATDPGSYAATFTGPTSAPNTQTLGGDFDQMTTAPTYQNDTIRPYRNMDMVEIITVGGQIPEPTGAMLALCGTALLAGLRRRG